MEQTEMTHDLEQARSGDRAAFTRLYEQTAANLLWYCRGLCGAPDEAEELVQEAYLTAWEKLNTFRDGSFPAWLRTIARNRYLNQMRRAQPQLWSEALLDTVPDETLTAPEEAVEQSELQTALMQCIMTQLSPPQRMTVLLYYYDERSVPEIAREMDCTEGTVKSRLYYARKKLREALEDRGYVLSGAVPLVLRMPENLVLRPKPLRLFAKAAASETAKAAGLSLKAKLIAGVTAAAVAGTVGGTIAYRSTRAPEPSAVIESTETTATERTKLPAPTAAVPAAEPLTEPITETEPQTDVTPTPGGDPVEYTFTGAWFRMSVPENYRFHSRETGEHPSDRLWQQSHEVPPKAQGVVRFVPDEESGDGIWLSRNEGLTELLDSLTDRYEITVTEDKDYPIDPEQRAEYPDSPETLTAQRITFTGERGGVPCTGFGIHADRGTDSQEQDLTVLFVDCSGTRAEEFAAAEESIVFQDWNNSNWMDGYDIPDEFQPNFN